MGSIIKKGERIIGANACVCILAEDGIFGHGEYIDFGRLIHVETKYGKSYTGFLADYEPATEEGRQDCIVIVNQDGKEHRVGIYDIVLLDEGDTNGSI